MLYGAVVRLVLTCLGGALGFNFLSLTTSVRVVKASRRLSPLCLSFSQAAAALVAAAYQQGSMDNISAIVVRLSSKRR